ncbi:GT2 family glycosyltransferase [Arthrobacter ulcerisalmonis]|uniref:glycosyltransferase family 2 protein n=1 Tax=Arthrobacter sp. B1I2 TaxID=3042263 RepID=UPI002782F3EC|nr:MULTISPECIES: glycosyltransferase [Arthrobacter]MDQ0662293.1 GT2 family glycosyltransferase [Arthrobacter ulcerisalmonis]MDQ0730221.1 GT2 family glycosyltransferase [Arthrobacter sp. B1I2]
MIIPDLAALVVHHRSYQTLGATLAALVSGGVAPDRLLVVDNSEEPGRRAEVDRLLPPGAHAIYCANAGYGAAVNRGASWHEENTHKWQYLLVATHESKPEADCLGLLRAALAEDPGTAVVGPVLVTGDEGKTIWSRGGHFTRVLGLPRHRGHLQARSCLAVDLPQPVSWLDGALLMFRRGILAQYPIDESYFLYMEEADHHQTLQRHGWKVKVNPRAFAWQQSNGVPPFYLTRNIQIFHAKNGSRFQALVSAPYLLARSVGRDLIKQQHMGTFRPLLAGLQSGRVLASAARAKQPVGVIIVNPLGGALRHYTKALHQHLVDAGIPVQVKSLDEPSVSGKHRLAWLLEYVELLGWVGWHKRRRSVPPRILVTWPVLGFWDLLLVKVLCGSSSWVVYHDPTPLVRSTGSGRAVSAFVGKVKGLPEALVHSEEAAEAMCGRGFADGLTVVRHPVLPYPSERPPTETVKHDPDRRPRIRVLGQYKPDRDLDLLESLAVRLGSRYDCEIIGRGWPTVKGWRVDARFVPEDELDHLIAGSTVILIPYKRFFQSGIAIRALEQAVPVVGRSETSLGDLFGPQSGLLVGEQYGAAGDVDAWLGAIDFAATNGRAEAYWAAESFHRQAADDWALLAAPRNPLT